MNSLIAALIAGVAPFIIWDIFKAFVSAPTAYYFKPIFLKLKLLVKIMFEAEKSQLLVTRK